ncbi:hypothetical protein GCM10027567_13600 [Spongiibacter taiwanensis]
MRAEARTKKCAGPSYYVIKIQMPLYLYIVYMIMSHFQADGTAWRQNSKLE